jgi:hypothetical protein
MESEPRIDEAARRALMNGQDVAEREFFLVKTVESLRILCIRISRAKNDKARANLVGHANRLCAAVGVKPNILREYTEAEI